MSALLTRAHAAAQQRRFDDSEYPLTRLRTLIDQAHALSLSIDNAGVLGGVWEITLALEQAQAMHGEVFVRDAAQDALEAFELQREMT